MFIPRRLIQLCCVASLSLWLTACVTTPQKDAATTEGDSPLSLAFSHALQGGSARQGAPNYALPPVDVTDPSEDIFQRIRNGFAMQDIHSDLVLYHQQRYMNQPESLRRIVERSSRYLYHIVNEIDKRGMPMELALLPMVESAFNPMAYSRAKASGLWQFIPATGKRFNLGQNWWKDERRDIVASTAAALDYLQYIYELQDDWHLALASYNWGEGSVARAVNKNQARNLPTDYLSLTMPEETRNYVPRLQALKNIFNNPALVAELRLPKIPNRPYFETIRNPGNIDIKLAAQLAGISVDEFIALNPAHNRPVITANSSMAIPAARLDAFKSNLDARTERKEALSTWQTYTLRAGEKLDVVARRFGTNAANLKMINGLSARSKVLPGQTLLVPGNGGELRLDALTGNMPLEEPATSRKDKSQEASAPTHTVRKGETFASIAKRYGTSSAELKRLNPRVANAPKPGSHLILAAKERAPERTSTVNAKPNGTAKTPPAASVATDKNKPVNTNKVTQYTVRKGDTLRSIARHFKVNASDIQRWNKLASTALMPGQTLAIQTPPKL